MQENIVRTMKMIIISKFRARRCFENEEGIDIPISDLEQIGITKCFDVENNCVIDYDNTKDVRIKEINERIAELKQLLAQTDYRAIKYAEGMYTEEEYAQYKFIRQGYRDEINTLEEELKELNK